MSQSLAHFAKLPPLPVPKLNQTLEQYVRYDKNLKVFLFKRLKFNILNI